MSIVHRDLWPEDIRSDDAATPFELLREQAESLEKRTKGLLSAEVVLHETEDRIILGFEVEVPRTGTRTRLFEVQHRHKDVYPVAIYPPKESLPDYLKPRFYQQSRADLLNLQNGGWVDNEWVATSPDEFAKKIEKLLSLATVKATIFSMLSQAQKTQPGNGAASAEPNGE